MDFEYEKSYIENLILSHLIEEEEPFDFLVNSVDYFLKFVPLENVEVLREQFILCLLKEQSRLLKFVSFPSGEAVREKTSYLTLQYVIQNLPSNQELKTKVSQSPNHISNLSWSQYNKKKDNTNYDFFWTKKLNHSNLENFISLVNTLNQNLLLNFEFLNDEKKGISEFLQDKNEVIHLSSNSDNRKGLVKGLGLLFTSRLNQKEVLNQVKLTQRNGNTLLPNNLGSNNDEEHTVVNFFVDFKNKVTELLN